MAGRSRSCSIHAKPSLTADIYMRRKKRATGAAEVLEGLFQP
jgi:hypothetical protein